MLTDHAGPRKHLRLLRNQRPMPRIELTCGVCEQPMTSHERQDRWEIRDGKLVAKACVAESWRPAPVAFACAVAVFAMVVSVAAWRLA